MAIELGRYLWQNVQKMREENLRQWEEIEAMKASSDPLIRAEGQKRELALLISGAVGGVSPIGKAMVPIGKAMIPYVKNAMTPAGRSLMNRGRIFLGHFFGKGGGGGGAAAAGRAAAGGGGAPAALPAPPNMPWGASGAARLGTGRLPLTPDGKLVGSLPGYKWPGPIRTGLGVGGAGLAGWSIGDMIANALGLGPEEETQPQAKPIPDLSAGDPLAAALMGAGGGGGARSVMNVSAPYVDYTNRQWPTLPSAPDYSSAAPTAPAFTEEDQMAHILNGIAAGVMNIDPRSPLSHYLFRAGMGALGGYASGSRERGEATRAFEKEKADFNRWQAGQQFSDQIALANAIMNLEGAKLDAQAKNAAQLTPKIDGGYAIIPSLKNGKVNYSVNTLPDPKLSTRLALAGAGVDVPDIMDVALLSMPDLVSVAAKRAGFDAQYMRGAGMGDRTVDRAAQAKVLEVIRQEEPELYAQLVQQARMRKLVESLR